MRILTVSDFEAGEFKDKNFPKSLGGADLIISCGDLAPEYLSRLVAVLDIPLFYVRGNHDIRYKHKPPQGGINIHGKLVRFGALRLMGLEGSRWYNGGPIQYTEARMRKTIRRLRPTLWWNKGVDIVVTHAPPRHVHDAEDLCHRGFRSFRTVIDKYRPRLFLHGHIHGVFENDDQRVTMVNQTKVVNSCGFAFLDIRIG